MNCLGWDRQTIIFPWSFRELIRKADYKLANWYRNMIVAPGTNRYFTAKHDLRDVSSSACFHRNIYKLTHGSKWLSIKFFQPFFFSLKFPSRCWRLLCIFCTCWFLWRILGNKSSVNNNDIATLLQIATRISSSIIIHLIGWQRVKDKHVDKLLEVNIFLHMKILKFMH